MAILGTARGGELGGRGDGLAVDPAAALGGGEGEIGAVLPDGAVFPGAGSAPAGGVEEVAGEDPDPWPRRGVGRGRHGVKIALQGNLSA